MQEWGVPPLPVLSLCTKLDLVLGTGASFNLRFMSVAMAGIIAGTRSGRSWGTNCGELHPLIQVCQSRTWVGGFLGGCGGPIPKGLLIVSNRLEWCSIAASAAMGLGFHQRGPFPCPPKDRQRLSWGSSREDELEGL